MSIDFSNVTKIEVPEGEVSSIRANGKTIWAKYWNYTLAVNASNNLVVGGVEDTILSTSKAEMNAQWTSDGYGPFGSFYAAFDPSDGNRMIATLNPNDLTEDIDGNDVDVTTNNIMWCVPTVYWYVENGTLHLTNDPDAGGEAYAHTIDGHVYDYIAIGVYEAYKDGNVLKSSSGKTPTVSQNRATFRTQAIANPVTNLDGKAMLWNFYQWELYKYCSYAVMGGFNSQSIVGNGNVSSSASSSTGALNIGGAYQGDTAGSSSSVKCFIENAWGSVWDFVDGVVVNKNSGIWISQSSNPVDQNTGSTMDFTPDAGPEDNPSNNPFKNHDYSQYKSLTIPATGTFSMMNTSDARVWGYADSNGTSATTGDYGWSGSNVLYVGGRWNNGSDAGVSSAASSIDLSFSSVNIGARLAFVFDAE